MFDDFTREESPPPRTPLRGPRAPESKGRDLGAHRLHQPHGSRGGPRGMAGGFDGFHVKVGWPLNDENLIWETGT